MPRTQIMNALRNTAHPVVYEVNTRVLVNELSAREGHAITLATIPDDVLDEWSEYGFDAVWLMGVWTTGAIGREIARVFPGLQEEYKRALPDLTDDDVAGSPYAVKAYKVSPELGGNVALRKLRRRLADRGISLLLDFVCNHTARDHQWVTQHPEYYIHGAPNEDVDRPEFFFKTKTRKGGAVLAFGRDPTFPGWTDTAQLNHASSATREAVINELHNVAKLCDGVRCDMAMLMLTSVFSRTWGDRAVPVDGAPPAGEFWKTAIESARAENPDFVFIAEAYWNREWDLQQLGFDYTYDKILYDRLLREGAGSVREHLKADVAFQRHCLRFLENHDEPRATRMLPNEPWQFAAATVAATVPGMFLLHDGQLEGRTTRLPVQLKRRIPEAPSLASRAFYAQLLKIAHDQVIQHGEWHLLDVRPSWHDNYTWQNYLVFWWDHPEFGSRLVVANYAPHSGQCYVDLPLDRIEGQSVEFKDLLGSATYVRDRAGLAGRGMYFDLPGYGIHIFEVADAKKQVP
jgi:glycosidase